jgi:hypothetical protein
MSYIHKNDLIFFSVVFLLAWVAIQIGIEKAPKTPIPLNSEEFRMDLMEFEPVTEEEMEAFRKLNGLK